MTACPWGGIDGRNRSLACALAGVAATTTEFTGTDEEARDLVWRENIVRHRHLTPAQKACAIAVLIPAEDMRGGDRRSESFKTRRRSLNKRELEQAPEPGPAPEAPTLARHASDAGVGARTVSSARHVLTNAPEVFERMRDGRLDAKPAERIAKLPDEKRAQVLERIDRGITNRGSASPRSALA